MKNYLKYQPPWVQLISFVSFTMIFAFIVSLLIPPVILNAYGLEFSDLSDYSNPHVVSAIKILQTILSITLFLIPSLLFSQLSDARPLHYIGFRKPMPMYFLIIAVIVMLSAFPMVAWLGDLNQHMHLPKGFKGMENWIRKAENESNMMLRHLLEMNSPKDLLAMLITLAVIPAMVEEFFFRGVLQRLLIQILKRPWAGIILTGMIFSAIHGQFLGFLPRAALGIILGALFWYSGSLWPGILAHFVNNALQIIVVYFNPGTADQDPNFSVGLITVSIFVVAALVWWMRKISQTTYAEVYDTDDDFNIGRRDQYSE